MPPITGAKTLDRELWFVLWPPATVDDSGRTTVNGGYAEVIVVKTNTTEPSDLVLDCEVTMIEGAGVMTVV